MPVFLSILFVLFAFLQLNDPDWYIWTPIYFWVAISILAIYTKYDLTAYYRMLALIFLIGFLSYIPEMIDWVDKGMPSITSSMKAEKPYIESVREALGLLICSGAMGYMGWKG